MQKINRRLQVNKFYSLLLLFLCKTRERGKKFTRAALSLARARFFNDNKQVFYHNLK